MSRQITEHFSESELQCKCGCERMEFTDAAVERLEKLRLAAGFPIIINSAYRCPDHNVEVSSTGPDGPHTKVGLDNITVDIKAYGAKAYRLVTIAPGYGFTGIGAKQNGPKEKRFIHLDCIMPGGLAPRPWVWSY
jgi:hypothetical protein